VRSRRLAIGAASALLLIPLALSGFVATALLQMLHMPRKVVPDPRNAQHVSIETSDHIKLKAAWLPAAQVRDCVLFLHGVGGWRGRSQRFTPWLSGANYSVLAPDLRAHGESGGDTVTYGLLEQYDTLAWTSWMRQQGCQRLYGLGESMGASILIMAEGLHPGQPTFNAIVAECPFADLQEAAEERGEKIFPLPAFLARPLANFAVYGGLAYARYEKDLDFRESSPVRSIAKIQTPVLLIHGADDTRTPPSHSRELAAANPTHTKLWIVPRARHVGSYSADPVEYRKRVLDWYANSR
jgi:alpha-beta hydrolase superfamily lysophospholipase